MAWSAPESQGTHLQFTGDPEILTQARQDPASLLQRSDWLPTTITNLSFRVPPHPPPQHFQLCLRQLKRWHRQW